ncbi:uncharacterized protein SCHCODRAFT_02258372 [Schizophyllum commune H4-8]|uniref:uncharacterized protein n=1 Tax=Schizophyllum commune (strain H4-8 / FGSC 9210) TaxID=578458 RepID=UPI00215ED28E|nr:uncharacterized protein SCHCODRAFT_02258372 [Schizophyllum commune H4-8]KAI5893660.1 hypothetical protein SCHCODRAFT_02258372 [Schizophyllum commune H4-8]
MFPTTFDAPPPPATEVVVSEILRKQTSFKWHSSFERLNRCQPGIAGLLEFGRAWILLADALQPRNINDPGWQRDDLDSVAVNAAVTIVNDTKRLPVLLEVFLGP